MIDIALCTLLINLTFFLNLFQLPSPLEKIVMKFNFLPKTNQNKSRVYFIVFFYRC